MENMKDRHDSLKKLRKIIAKMSIEEINTFIDAWHANEHPLFEDMTAKEDPETEFRDTLTNI